jgi:hypothetical protein
VAIIWRPNNMRTYIHSYPSEVDADYWDVPCWTPIHILSSDPIWSRIQIGCFVGYVKNENILTKGDTNEINSRIIRKHRRGN